MTLPAADAVRDAGVHALEALLQQRETDDAARLLEDAVQHPSDRPSGDRIQSY